jgi:putative ABC transport system permease protein
MLRIAIRMIMGDRLKYLGLLVGLSFAAMLITQQASIFMGYTQRMWAPIEDQPHVDIWVMDPQVRSTQDSKHMQGTILQRVRGIEGVEWAVPMYRGSLNAQLANGTQELSTIIGIDDSTLLGGPTTMIDGTILDLRQADAVIVEKRAADGDLLWKNPDGTTRPLGVGDLISINDRSARVVGVCETNYPFYWQPVIYTTFSRALLYAPQERKLMTYVLVGAKEGVDHEVLARRISAGTDMKARTSRDFAQMTMNYTLTKTGILVNFGITVGLGFVIGLLVCGQTFFNFIVDNTRLFGALKALGLSDARLLQMIAVQVLVVGAIGFGIGAGLAAIAGSLLPLVGVGFYMPWQLLVGAGVGVLGICLVSAFLSAIRVLRLEPGVVFKA